jgi:hypothetical protein
MADEPEAQGWGVVGEREWNINSQSAHPYTPAVPSCETVDLVCLAPVGVSSAKTP